jgi:hypothetical protein
MQSIRTSLMVKVGSFQELICTCRRIAADTAKFTTICFLLDKAFPGVKKDSDGMQLIP